VSKFCVFCGDIPNDKTKEHVVPQWLIKLTGDPKRQAFFGLRKSSDKDTKERIFSFDQFTFPACNACNEEYSYLEALVKPILSDVLAGNEVTSIKLSILLDWMDKIRIGLWLGFNQLDNLNPV